MNNAPRTRIKPVGIFGTKEIVTIYSPSLKRSSGIRFELITFISSGGKILSSANRYKREYKNRMYLGEPIKFLRSDKVEDIEEIHQRAYKMLKTYVKHNY